MRPLIAVTTTAEVGGSRNLPQARLNLQYVDAVDDAGGAAVLITPGHSPDSVRQLVAHTAGLILTGGEDVDPVRYGREPHPRLGDVSPERDEMELMAVREALRHRRPLLAICRGCQLVNVALGGTLVQDLEAERPEAMPHEQEGPLDAPAHTIRIEQGSRLHAIVGKSQAAVNSFHHQAVERLAPGLAATAWADDGVVEAFEGVEHPWLLAVQWHPERARLVSPPDRAIFQAFVEAALRRGR